jgi:hypothetical protein
VGIADTVLESQDPAQEWARDGVGQVAGYPRSRGHEAGKVDGEGIAMDYLEVRRSAVAESCRELFVDLDGYHSPAARGQGQGEGPFAGTDFQEDVVGRGGHGAQQTLDGRGTEEVLAESSRHGRG